MLEFSAFSLLELGKKLKNTF